MRKLLNGTAAQQPLNTFINFLAYGFFLYSASIWILKIHFGFISSSYMILNRNCNKSSWIRDFQCFRKYSHQIAHFQWKSLAIGLIMATETWEKTWIWSVVICRGARIVRAIVCFDCHNFDDAIEFDVSRR